MRALVSFSLGFAAATALGAYGWTDWKGQCFLIAVLMAGGLPGERSDWWKRLLLILLGLGTGFGCFLRYEQTTLAPIRELHGSVHRAQLRVSDFPEETEQGFSLDAALNWEGRPYPLRLYLPEAPDVQPGDIIQGDFRFSVILAGNLRGNTYWQGRGIFLRAYEADTLTYVSGTPSRRDIPAFLRQKIKTVLRKTFPEDTEAFARALLLGDTSGLSYETDTSFKVSGIRHVAAVSGLHVSILFALVSILAFRNRWLMALLGFPLLFLFAAVAGFSASVSRACLMSGLMLLALLLNRQYDGPSALSFAVLVILLLHPMTVTSISFQLSAASVAGIYLFCTPICNWLTALFGTLHRRPVKAFLVRWLCTSVSTSLSAMIMTTPLCAWYFGTVSLIGPLTNLLTLWVISGILYGILGVCLCFLIFPAGAGILAWLVSWPIRYVLAAAKLLSQVPMAAVYTQNTYIVAWLVFVYCLLLYFSITSNKRPGLLACCALLGLCLAQLLGMGEPMLHSVSFTMLDVGQGQCLLFQTEGKTYMIDCGGDSSTKTADLAAQTLLSQGITKLDGLILTHLDEDHAGGVQPLLTQIETELLIQPNVHSNLEDTADCTWICASKPLEITLEQGRILVYPATFPGNSNEISLCILLDTKNCDILVTGDRNGFGERSLLRNYPIPDVDVLVAGHHGSQNSTCEELLNTVRPELVCISAGEGNIYGHPSPELLQRLQTFGCTVYRTDQHGTITIRR